MTETTAIIQARTGSTRLPGKIMYPLDGRPVIEHVIRRTAHASSVDTVVVATSSKDRDDVIAEYAPRFGAEVVRGSESDVLGRYEQAVTEYDSEIVLRITADCPLISPKVINAVVHRIIETKADYCSNIGKRTFPRGLDVEAFTSESFSIVCEQSSDPHHREHVTPYYHECSHEFFIENITSDEIYEELWMRDRTDLRLTLDEPDDYMLLRTIYQEVPYVNIIDIRDAVKYVDEHNLQRLNEHVEQKTT